MTTVVKEIKKKRFDALCYVRQAQLIFFATEISWYSIFDGKLLGIIVRDKTDKDYGFILLGRDKKKLFRAIKVDEAFTNSPAEAYMHMLEAIEDYRNDGKDCYPQGDEVILPNEIFEPIVPEEQLHPYFKILYSGDRHEAARNLIKEIAYSFTDVDGNYIQQFQTTGFDTRLWELFLHTYFYHAAFERNTNYNAPDFCLNKFGVDIYIEAVTVGSNPDFDLPAPKNGAEIVEMSSNYLPIKFGSSLWSKITRKNQYWEMSHVKNKPFILAIHDYHVLADGDNMGSMTWSKAGLTCYLYGKQDVVEIKDGEIVGPKMVKTKNGFEPLIERVESHTFKGKTIPSNFFEQENSENVSAVLFSNAATITTFNRMGKIAGLGSENIKVLRNGIKNTEEGLKFFSQDVDDPEYDENWSDTLIMYHNPNAKNPVDPDLFPDISHAILDKETGEIMQYFHPDHVWYSFSVSIKPTDC